MIAAVSLVAVVFWELAQSEPVLDLRLLGSRNLMTGCIFLLVAGLVVFGSTQTLPQLMQEVLGYTAANAGFAMTLGGIGAGRRPLLRAVTRRLRGGGGTRASRAPRSRVGGQSPIGLVIRPCSESGRP